MTQATLFESERREMIEEAGVCALCGDPVQADHNAHIDHCHETKVIRGVLCKLCNNGLGFFRDDVELLKKAIVYLEAQQRP